jgi:hypothetical protein
MRREFDRPGRDWAPSGYRPQLDSERFRSDPRTGRSACDRLSMEQDRPSQPLAQMAGEGALARLREREAIIMQMQQVDYFLTLCAELIHPRSPPLRRLATLADHRHRHAGAGAGRSAVLPKACNRIDRARAQGAVLPRRNRAQRGSRPRGCTDVDAASRRRPVSPSTGERFGAPIELMPLTLGSSCIRGGRCDTQQHPRAACGSVRRPV